MKLKNLMYATMVACAFASCSKEDVPEVPTVGTDGDVTLSLKVAAPLSSKAIANDETAGEDLKITTLTTYVFDAQTSKLEAVGDKITDLESKTIGLKAGTKKVIVLANIKPAVVAGLSAGNATTYGDFIKMSMANLANEKNGALSMNSQVFDVVLKAGVINYLGYDAAPDGGNIVLDLANKEVSKTPVKLYRNVAKVVLSKITLTDTYKERYPNAELTVQNVYILNGRSTTNIVGADAKAWGTTMSATSAYENGMTSAEYSTWVKTFEDIQAATPGLTPLFSYLNEGRYASTLFTDYVSAPGLKLTYGKSTDKAVDKFYVYENILAQKYEKGADANTLLVVKATLKYDGVPTPESRYYTVAIGHAGTDAVSIPAGFGMTNDDYKTVSGRADLLGVLRNFQYNISLTVAGPGYTTPVGPKPEDDTFLQVKVEVVPFGQVNQGSEIE